MRLMLRILSLCVLGGFAPAVLGAQDAVAASDGIATSVAPQLAALDRSAGLSVREVPLVTALSSLHETSGVRIAFSPSLLPPHRVSCECTNVTVRDALDRILTGTAFQYAEVGTQVIIEPAPETAIESVPGLRTVLAVNQAPRAVSDPSTRTTAARAEQGTITGRVTEARTQRPLANAQVVIDGTTIGALTDGDGRFTLTGVPAGEVTVRVQRIGYGTAEESVVVASGQTAEINFALQERAVGLDEVVVTGSPAGEQRRRAIGTNIASIDVENALADAPITSFGELLQAREPGMTSLASSGTAGTAGPMILRGITSLTQDNQPLIYLDGVRLDRSNTNLVTTGGQVVDRLNDINPQDIERIEVIKGSSATALYGSEASSGVIQIFTKRGRPGETRYTVGARFGANQIPKTMPLMHPDPQYPSANDLVSTGIHQEYNASIRGGAENMSYYAGFSHMDSEGSFVNNSMQRTGLRLNVEANPTETFTGSLSTSFNHSDIALPANDNWIYGILTTLYLGNPVTRGTEHDPWGGAFVPVPLALAREINDQAYRYTGGITLRHVPGDVFNHRMTVGVEVVEGRGINLVPYWVEPGRPDRPGGRNVNSRTNVQANIDYSASVSHRFTPTFAAQLSGGSQFFSRRDHRVFAGGTDFASPGLQALGGTALASVGESELSYVTGGLFTELELAHRDLLFLILGVRADGSSAFGENFGWQAFPKASLSYVVSDEDWFRFRGVNSLRLRGGFGTAGTQPGAFDAVRTFANVVGMHGRPGIRASTYGNPDLAPEISREFEGGFDVGVLEDRLSFSFTGYHQRTDDVLISRRYAPSLGLTATQLTNVGAVQNRGIELSANGIAIQRPTFQWSVNAGYSYNDNEVLDLGGAPFITVDRFGSRIVEGYPVSGKWEYVTVGTDEDGFPIRSDDVQYLGPSIPPHNANLGTSIGWGRLNARANGQFAWGHVVNYHLWPYMAINRTGAEYWQVVDEQGGGDPSHLAVSQYIARNRIFGDFIYPGDFFKLREISLSYGLPDRFVQAVGGRNASISLAGRNLLTVTDYPGSDPEVSSTFGDGNNLSVGADFFTVPPARQFVFGVNLDF